MQALFYTKWEVRVPLELVGIDGAHVLRRSGMLICA